MRRAARSPGKANSDVSMGLCVADLANTALGRLGEFERASSAPGLRERDGTSRPTPLGEADTPCDYHAGRDHPQPLWVSPALGMGACSPESRRSATDING
jgi:hypothetical protein